MQNKYLKFPFVGILSAASLCICIALFGCSKPNTDGGETVFKNVEDIFVDDNLEGLNVELGSLGSVSSWPNSDYYPEIGSFNFKFDDDFENINMYSVDKTAWLNPKLFFQNIKFRILRGNAKTTTMRQPILFKDTIVVANKSGKIFAMDTEHNMKIIWQTSIRQIVDDKNAYDALQILFSYGNGKVFAATNNGFVFALNAETGELEWKQNLRATIRVPFKYDRGRLYGISSLNEIIVLKAFDGEVVWKNQTATASTVTLNQASILLTSDSFVASYTDGTVAAFTKDTFATKWVHDIATGSAGNLFSFADIDSTPIAVDGMIICAGINGGMYMINESTGNIVWNKNIGSVSAMSISGNFLFVIDSHNRLICIYWPRGLIKWITELETFDNVKVAGYLNNGNDFTQNRIKIYGPYIVNNQLVLQTGYGLMWIYSAQTGNLMETHRIPYQTEPMIMVKKKMYAFSDAWQSVISIG